MTTIKMISLFILGISLQSSRAADDWSYSGSTGPLNWGKTYPKCNGNSQSPINIYEGDVTASVSEPFQFINYDNSLGMSLKLSNTGYTAKVSIDGENVPEISGGGLGGVFVAAQFHFHWNTDVSKGSEHLISSHGFPGELHIVHFRKTYGTLDKAVNKTDGLAVLGFMLEISDQDNEKYIDLISSLAKVTKKGDVAELSPATINSLLPADKGNFYRYPGSLTTPACFESVTWTVFKEPIKISKDQLEAFYELKKDDTGLISDNVRPVLPLNSREVLANFNPNIKWSYHHGECDADSWKDFYSACGGKAQSPINIPATAATVDVAMGKFNFGNFDSTSSISMVMRNDGHTFKVTMSGTPLQVSGGDLPDTYNVAQFHFHWGLSSIQGSEHAMDGKRYPNELHIVTYKASLGSLGKAVKEPEGLAVLGFFFEITENDNTNWDPIISAFPNLKKPGSATNINPVAMDTLIPANRTNFFRYPGSLTTPGCYESVIWTVFSSTIPISESQMAKFRGAKSSDKDKDMVSYPMVDNFRPVQNLNTRIVKANFVVPTPPKQEWTYTGLFGPQNWKKYFPTCGSTLRQSPIDIDNTEVIRKDMPPFVFTNFNTGANQQLKMINNGHTVKVGYESGKLQVSGGGLPGDSFRVAQFHLHWGATSEEGSEHTIDGKMYPLELHIVTYNEMYADINVAVTQGNGLAVLGVIFEVSETDEDNPALNDMLASLPSVKDPKTDVSLAGFRLDSLLPRNKAKFYRYDGSLTTPNCAESVTWTVFEETLTISEKQLEKFRQLISSDKDGDGKYVKMVNNYRPTLALGNREVYANFLISGTPSTTSPQTSLLASMLVLLGRWAWN